MTTKPTPEEYRQAAIATLVLAGKLCFAIAQVLAEPILPGKPRGPQGAATEPRICGTLNAAVEQGSRVLSLTAPPQITPLQVRLDTAESIEIRRVERVEGTRLHLDAPTVQSYPKGASVRLYSVS